MHEKRRRVKMKREGIGLEGWLRRIRRVSRKGDVVKERRRGNTIHFKR
jgi:hypothetical protein